MINRNDLVYTRNITEHRSKMLCIMLLIRWRHPLAPLHYARRRITSQAFQVIQPHLSSASTHSFPHSLSRSLPCRCDHIVAPEHHHRTLFPLTLSHSNPARRPFPRSMQAERYAIAAL